MKMFAPPLLFDCTEDCDCAYCRARDFSAFKLLTPMEKEAVLRENEMERPMIEWEGADA